MKDKSNITVIAGKFRYQLIWLGLSKVHIIYMISVPWSGHNVSLYCSYAEFSCYQWCGSWTGCGIHVSITLSVLQLAWLLNPATFNRRDYTNTGPGPVAAMKMGMFAMKMGMFAINLFFCHMYSGNNVKKKEEPWLFKWYAKQQFIINVVIVCWVFYYLVYFVWYNMAVRSTYFTGMSWKLSGWRWQQYSLNLGRNMTRR